MSGRFSRREALALLAALLPEAARAQMAFAPTGLGRFGTLPLVSPDVHIRIGQSWAENDFPAFSGVSVSPPGIPFAISPQGGTLLALFVTNSGAANGLKPGPLPNSAGISLPATPSDITAYLPTDRLSIGRCAILAQQIFRFAAGVQTQPIIEFCAAWPASTWGYPGPGLGSGGGLQPGGQSWANMLLIIAAIKALFPRQTRGLNLGVAQFSSFGYTQGVSTDGLYSTKLAELTNMMQTIDALSLPSVNASLQKVYLTVPPSQSAFAVIQPSFLANIDFCRTNAPGTGGPYSGRVFCTSPMYPYPFEPDSNIHTGDFGTARTGEMEGYARHLTQDRGIPWTPLWLSLTRPITVSGQTIKIPFDAPPGPDFAGKPIIVKGDPEEGISLLPDRGVKVYSGNTPLTVTGVTPVGADVYATVSETLSSGMSLEISYAARGIADGSDATPNSSLFGNLCMEGPRSALFPDRKLPAWAMPFQTTITV